MTTISTRCRPTRTRRIAVLRFGDVDGTGCREAVRFERDVAFVVESQSRVAYVHGGVELDGGPTCSDFYGFLRSVEGAAEDAAEAAARHKVDAASTLVVEVRSRLVATAVLPEPIAGSMGATSYVAVPDDWLVDVPRAEEAFAAFAEGRGSEDDLPKSVRSLIGVPEDEFVTWSTRMDAAAVREARQRFAEVAHAFADAEGLRAA